MMGSQLICENLILGYDGNSILEPLNFSVERGDYLCIVGDNGSGKSTLMKTVLGLTAPLAGTISFSDDLLQTQIGYLPQQTVVQKDFPASVEEIVRSGCLNTSKSLFYNSKVKVKANDCMEKVEIATLGKRCYRELSGGQQQRVLLARALCATEKMLVLDEPAAGLDPHVTQGLYDVIENLNNSGITVIMISHDIPSVLKYARHILHIGAEIFFGTKQDYIKKMDGCK